MTDYAHCNLVSLVVLSPAVDMTVIHCLMCAKYRFDDTAPAIMLIEPVWILLMHLHHLAPRLASVGIVYSVLFWFDVQCKPKLRQLVTHVS